MNERTVITSAAAIAAIGLLSLFLAYRHEPSAAEPDPASAVSTIAPASDSTAQPSSESASTSPATTTEPETSSTSDPSITTASSATASITTASTAVPRVPETVGGTGAVGPEEANTTEAVPTPTIVLQCQQAAYLAYVPTNIPDETLPPVTAQTELCVPISALRPGETIVGAFLTEGEACGYRNQYPGTSVRGLQLSDETDPCG